MFKPPELYKTEYIIILLPYVFLKLFLIWGWECSYTVEYMLSLHQALGSNASIKKNSVIQVLAVPQILILNVGWDNYVKVLYHL